MKTTEGMEVIDEFIRLCFRIISLIVECRNLALRMRDRLGDYPFYMYEGLSEEFVKEENSIVDMDRWGNKRFACLCGQVIAGPVEEIEKFFTEYGSFWRNAVSHEILEYKDVIYGFRSACLDERFNSLALIPIEANNRKGLFHISDPAPGRFDRDTIAKLEKVARHLGAFLARLDDEWIEKKRCSVVIVDEYAINASVVQEMLSEYGHSCIAFGDPFKAYHYVVQHRVDVLITEIVLPGMTGFEMIEKIQKKLGVYAPHVVVLTSSPAKLQEDDVERYRIRRVIQKPLRDIKELQRCLENLV